MRLLVDAQLPPALARWLAANGHEAEHVADRGLAAASDTEIWTCAIAIGAAIGAIGVEVKFAHDDSRGMPAIHPIAEVQTAALLAGGIAGRHG